MGNDEMLLKEKKISDSVKELRKQLLERETVLHSFDEYESIMNEISRLNDEVTKLESTPFSTSLDNLVGETNVYIVPMAISEMNLYCYHVSNQPKNINGYINPDGIFMQDTDNGEKIGNMDIIPTSMGARTFIIADAFKDFMIDVRKKSISFLKNRADRILAGIDSEIEEIEEKDE